MVKVLIFYIISWFILRYTYDNVEMYYRSENYLNIIWSIFLCLVYICCNAVVVCSLYGHTYSVIYLRPILYRWVKNKRIQRYLDSIFLFKYFLLYPDSGRHQSERCKNYLFAILTFPLTLLILLLPFLTYFVRSCFKHAIQEYNQEFFDFEKLPFSIQDRFLVLQPPLVKKQFKQIYPWIKIDKFLVDKLHIDAQGREIFGFDDFIYMHRHGDISEEVEWKNISESWNFAQFYFEEKTLLVVRFHSGRKLNWKMDTIKAFKIVKTVIFTKLKPFEFQHLYNNLNLSMISELEIKQSNLTLKEFALIKQLDLKSIYVSIKLENGYSNLEMIDFIMQILTKVPKIRVFFDCYYEGNFFEDFIIDWIIKNGYREYYSFTFRTHHFPWYLTFSGDSLIINGCDCYSLAL